YKCELGVEWEEETKLVGGGGQEHQRGNIEWTIKTSPDRFFETLNTHLAAQEETKKNRLLRDQRILQREKELVSCRKGIRVIARKHKQNVFHKILPYDKQSTAMYCQSSEERAMLHKASIVPGMNSGLNAKHTSPLSATAGNVLGYLHNMGRKYSDHTIFNDDTSEQMDTILCAEHENWE
ncbi:hypothetical protein ACJX0J_025881, partial [Zea mays]